MRPLRLRLSGLTRFAEPIDIDLSELPPGLVAVVGGNGEGKTTILDALGPVPLFRELSTKPGSLKDWSTRRDTSIDVEIAFGGRVYRHLVTVDPLADGGRGKEEAYLFEDGHPITNGRVKDYDEAVRKVYRLPDEAQRARDAVYASAFAKQDRRGSFANLKPADRKDLFAHLLGLGALQRIAERAKEHRAPLDAAAKRFDEEATTIARDREARDQVRSMIAASEVELAPLVAAEERATAAHATAAAAAATAIATLEQLEAARTVAEKRIAELAVERAAATQEAATVRSQIERIEALTATEGAIRERAAALDAANRAADQLTNDWRAADATAKAHTAAANAAMEARDRAAAAAQRARASLAGAREALDALPNLRARLAPLAELRAKRVTLDAAIRDEDTALRLAQRDARNEAGADDLRVQEAHAALRGAEGKAELVDGVPCKGRTLYEEEGGVRACGTCRFLTDGAAARDQLPDLRRALDDAKAKRTATQRRVDEATTRGEALTAQRAALTALDGQIGALTPDEHRLLRYEATAEAATGAQATLDEHEAARVRHAEELDAAKVELATATAALERIVADGASARTRQREHAGADEALREFEAARVRLPMYRDQLARAEHRLQAAETAHAAVRLPPAPTAQREVAAAAGAAAEVARVALSGARGATQAAREALARLNGRLAQIGDVEARQGALDARRLTIATRRAGLVLLEAAFGREGIQALEIDAAGPEVSGLCNALLEACYGPRFLVALRTVQEAKGARVQKEVFDVAVLDALRGGSARPIEGFSGGEQVLINEAIRLAIAVFNARRHGAQFEVLFRDEGDTGLGVKERPHYPAMLRRACELGGFRNVFFITHHPEVWEQADALLRVEGGRVTVATP